VTLPFLTQGSEKSAGSREAAARIEDWLLHSGIQIEGGPEQGGVAGWLEEHGRPEFVYLEIAGYYLTALAWLSSGAATSARNTDAAQRSAGRVADWIANAVSSGYLPTRLYLSEETADWRNGGVFSFDLAMAARGLSAARQMMGIGEPRHALERLSTMLHNISLGGDVMVSHEPISGKMPPMPDSWSTRPGPHHLKAAAAVLHLPRHAVSESLRSVAGRTFDHWTPPLEAGHWPCRELHPLLYGLEGMLIRAGSKGGPSLSSAELAFTRLMKVQAADGTLTETVDGGIVRSDVLAQALRVGLLLRSRGYLADAEWSERLDRLAGALMGFVQPDGGVHFACNQSVSNTCCAMFAQQALYLYSRRGMHDAVPAAAFNLLV